VGDRQDGEEGLILGFLLTALYCPGIAGAATTPRWGLLAVALPLILCFRGGVEKHGDFGQTRSESPGALDRIAGVATGPRFTLIHLFGSLFLAWSAISLIWTPNRLDGIGELIKLVILAQAFLLGSRLESLRRLLLGMSAGLILSSVTVLIQLGWPDIVYHTTTHSGLFINSGSLGEIAALVLIGLIWDGRNARSDVRGVSMPAAIPRIYALRRLGAVGYLALGLLPCILLPASRGAWLALIAAFTLWLWGRSKLSALALIVLAIGSLAFSLHEGFHASSVVQRLGMWGDAVSGLDYLGHGIGSFWTDYAPLSNTLDIFVERPEHLHNDWLEIVFEQGAVGIAAVGILGTWCLFAATRRRASVASYVLIGFAAESLVGFTLHVPCTAFVAALCLGHLARGRADIRDILHAGRVSLCSWLAGEQPAPYDRGIARECAAVSV
jgi:hypothetical protein